MKILVFNGSPKRDNSDTLRITRAFLDGMQEAAVVTEPRLASFAKRGISLPERERSRRS